MYFQFLSGHSINSEYSQVIGSFVHSFFSIFHNPYIILKISGKLAGQLVAVIHGTIKGHIIEPLQKRYLFIWQIRKAQITHRLSS